MGNYSPEWSSFDFGELSPLLEGRTDMGQYMRGGKICLNFLPNAQGSLTRRGGTRYLSNTSTNQASLLVRFSRSQTESYILEFADHILHFYYNGAIVNVSPGVPYTVATPYAITDLYNTDGTPKIGTLESVDVIYLTHPNYPPQTLSFFAPTNWVLAAFVSVDGPWQDKNANLALTTYVTGAVTIGSTVTVTASAPLFTAGMVGGLFRIEQQDLTTLKPWQPGEQTPNLAVGSQRRSGFCTYQATVVAYGTIPTGGTNPLYIQTGGSTLIHTQGKAWDGDQTVTLNPVGGPGYYSTGVQWQYMDCGYGVIQITGFTDSTHVTGTVLRQLPSAVIGSPNASNIWQLGAWSNAAGWPAHVTMFRQRLTFAGGVRVWMSVTGDFTNFADKSFGQITADSATTLVCISDQVNNIVYLQPSDTLLVGTTGAEFFIGPQSISDPFGPLNSTVSLQSTYGGRAVQPVRVQQFTLFVNKNGRRLYESAFSFTSSPTGAYLANDKTVLSEHITQSGIVDMVWAKNPWNTIWCALSNGGLIAFSYQPEQQVYCWARHQLGSNGKVLCVTSVPSANGDVDDVYMIVQRMVVNGNTVLTSYQVERIEQPYLDIPGADQDTMFYVDTGATLNNTINTTLLIPVGGNVKGAINFNVFAGTATFAATDVGRYIHYDYQTTYQGDDGLTYPLAGKAVLLITGYSNSTTVQCTINAPFPNGQSFTIPANGWRMTVTMIITPLFAWQNQTISILADGAVQPDQVMPFGASTITLQWPASYVSIGIKSPAVFQTMKPTGGDPTGSSMGKLKRIVKATFRFVHSLGLKVGADWASLQYIDARSPLIPNDQAPPVMSGDTPRDTLNADWGESGRIMIAQDQPLPLTLCAISALAEFEPDS